MTGWIKICGIRDVATAVETAVPGVSAIGLNFFEKSVRHVRHDVAQEIGWRFATLAEHWASRQLAISPSSPMTVGLFVNHSLETISQFVSMVGLGAIQLHGDESPEFLRELHQKHPQQRLIKAFRVGDSLTPIAEFLEECRQLNVPLAGCLLDAKVDGAFGGTGKVAPWELIANDYDRANWPPLILAGGLTAENVAEAIQTVQPFGVDTASGVESSPGVKDTKLLARFVAEARRAFAELGDH